MNPFSLSFVWHDCFVLDSPHAGSFVFDFWTDPRSDGKGMPDFVARLRESGKRVFFIVSHHHKDHFVKDIFEWSLGWPEAHYVISRDTAKMMRHMLRPESIWKGVRVPPEQITILSPGESAEIDGVRFDAFGSTDIGNSYVITIPPAHPGDSPLHIFHAGDLNAWLWKDESTPAEVTAALRGFTDILAVISRCHPHLDVAMMPVDSRIGSEWYTGASLLVRAIDIDMFIPMHFCLGTPEEIERRKADALRFELYANPKRGSYIGLTSPGDCICSGIGPDPS